MGIGHQAHFDGQSTEIWATSTGQPWDCVSRYLSSGPRLSTSGYSWWVNYPGNGGMIPTQCDDVNTRGMMNVFIYEQMYCYSSSFGYPGGDGGNYYGNINNGFNNATFMGHYYNDFASFVQLADTWLQGHPGKYITVDVEPDVWGFMEQNAPSPDPTTESACVASATNPGAPFPNLAGLPNTVAGYAKAMHRIRSQFAPTTKSRLLLAFHASSWAAARGGAPPSKGNVALSQGAVVASAVATDINTFLSGCRGEAGVGDWDMIFVDPSDGDAGLYQTYGETAGFSHSWDPANVTQPTPNRYRDFCDSLSGLASLRIVMWQVPIGNSAMTNVNGHWKDNKAEYFFASGGVGLGRVCDWAAHGVIGIIWGRGALVGPYSGTSTTDYKYTTGQNEYSGGTVDGCTTVYPGLGYSCPSMKDDDGGYLRGASHNYFDTRCYFSAPGSPTFSPTKSPNYSPTTTPTVTPTPMCPGGMLADFNTASQTNNWGGWVSGYAGGGTSTFSQPSPGQSGGFCSRVTGTNVAASPSNLNSGFNAGGTAVDISMYGGVRFWFKGNIAQYRVNIHTSNGSFDDWGFVFNMVSAGTWTYIQVPFASLSQIGWGPAAWMPTSALQVAFFQVAAGAYDFSVDDIEFYCPPPTPTPSVTSSRTPSATASRTPTVSPTASPSLTRTSTPTASPSPSVTTTRTGTATPSASPSQTQTSTPSQTRTATPSITMTFTVLPGTPTNSPSPTATPSRSPTVTPTHSPTVTSTQTPTATRSATPSVSPTITLSFTAVAGSPTSSPTPSTVVSPTQSPSVTMTRTSSATPSVSMTGTLSPSFSYSPTASATMTQSATLTVSATLTASLTASPTPTQSLTPSASPSSSPSGTQSSTLTPSPTLTATGSVTVTRTPSLTATISVTLTDTPVYSPTPTWTVTPSATLTRTQVPGSGPATIVPGSGPNEVESGLAVPNPNPKSIAVKMAGPCDKIKLTVYSRAMAVVLMLDGPGCAGPGWVQLPLGTQLDSLANGTYYYTLHGMRGGSVSPAFKGKLLLIK